MSRDQPQSPTGTADDKPLPLPRRWNWRYTAILVWAILVSAVAGFDAAVYLASSEAEAARRPVDRFKCMAGVTLPEAPKTRLVVQNETYFSEAYGKKGWLGQEGSLLFGRRITLIDLQEPRIDPSDILESDGRLHDITGFYADKLSGLGIGFSARNQPDMHTEVRSSTKEVLYVTSCYQSFGPGNERIIVRIMVFETGCERLGP